MSTPLVEVLRQRGVVLPAPAAVEIADDVDPARIAPGVVIHAGCRIRGAATSVGPGCVLGEEAPMTIENCRLGYRVRLRGGFASGAVFLDDASMGSAAHVRSGTLVEESASCAHAAGLKQTILMPYVTAGSLVNLCDLLLAGGVSRREHTEIGSSYVHFNFTPHGDKATPSLVGDAVDGVFCDRPAIFLGGQGGLVGPARMAYGVVIPAGIVWRGDALTPGVVAPPARPPATRPFVPGAYGAIGRRVRANLAYIGNLDAIRAWYREARAPYMRSDPWRSACWEGALACLEGAIEERRRRLEDLAARMERSVTIARSEGRLALPAAVLAEQERWGRQGVAVCAAAASAPPLPPPVSLTTALMEARAGEPWPAIASSLPAGARREAADWLRRHVDRCVALWPAAEGR